MTTLYRIRDWAKHFENNRTKELKRMAWVPMPTKHDGDGYTQLLDHKDGLAHFGAWCLIVEVAAKCDPRGTLLRDGLKPHDPDSLGRVTRAPAKFFRAVIPRLVSIGWLEACEISQEGAVISQEGAPSRARATQHGTEGNDTEEEGTSPPKPPQGGEVVALWNETRNGQPAARMPKDRTKRGHLSGFLDECDGDLDLARRSLELVAARYHGTSYGLWNAVRPANRSQYIEAAKAGVTPKQARKAGASTDDDDRRYWWE